MICLGWLGLGWLGSAGLGWLVGGGCNNIVVYVLFTSTLWLHCDAYRTEAHPPLATPPLKRRLP